MSREELLAQRQQTFQLSTDFNRALAAAYQAINTGRPSPERDALAGEALSVGESYGAALDKLLALLEKEQGNYQDEIERVLRFKELLQKEEGLLKQRPHAPS
jgi:hypothetical protein